MGADIIQDFVDWMESMAGTQLAGATAGIIAIAAIFAGIRLGKRLLHSSAGEGQCSNCGCPLEHGAEWEEDFMCTECLYELGEPEDRMRAEGMSADEIDRAMYPSAYADEEDQAGLYEEYHELLDNDDADGARQLADEHGLDVDWEQHTKNLIQEVIHRGDYALADSMCDEAGIDKLELDWH